VTVGQAGVRCTQTTKGYFRSARGLDDCGKGEGEDLMLTSLFDLGRGSFPLLDAQAVVGRVGEKERSWRVVRMFGGAFGDPVYCFVHEPKCRLHCSWGGQVVSGFAGPEGAENLTFRIQRRAGSESKVIKKF